jgi:hypothetical protein
MAKKKAPTEADIIAAEAAIAMVSRQVKFSVAEYPISVYVTRFEDDETGRFFVPEYQRKLAWHPRQQSDFIESLIVGLPIPFLFFYQTPDGRMEIVDGSQRMRAMRAFLREGLRLSDLVLGRPLAVPASAPADRRAPDERWRGRRSCRSAVCAEDRCARTRIRRVVAGGWRPRPRPYPCQHR